MPDRRRTLLSPGNDAWRALNDEKRRLLRPDTDTSVEELLRRGIRLSRQAGRLGRGLQDPRGAARP